MKQPLWLINISLLFVLLAGLIALYFLQAPIPRKVSLQPSKVEVEEKQSLFDVSLKKIYGVNDLFDTYVPQVPVVDKSVRDETVPPIPQAPAAIPLSIPVEKPPVFIAPLAATLKGVMYRHDNAEQSVAIIQMKDSKSEQDYQVGEMIQDAQILKIFANRVIVVRSNGQQETLYLRENEAKKDFAHEEQKGLESFKVVVQEDKSLVPLKSFLKVVHSLGDFIDLLDLTTVYKKGKSVGCRVGRAVKSSLGGKLGFQNDDIIKEVDGITVSDIASRIQVYDHIISKKIGDKVVVDLERSGKDIALTFVLSDHDAQNHHSHTDVKGSASKGSVSVDSQEQQRKILEQRVKLAPSAHQIQMDEQRKLLEARRKNVLSNRHMSKR